MRPDWLVYFWTIFWNIEIGASVGGSLWQAKDRGLEGLPRIIGNSILAGTVGRVLDRMDRFGTGMSRTGIERGWGRRSGD